MLSLNSAFTSQIEHLFLAHNLDNCVSNLDQILYSRPTLTSIAKVGPNLIMAAPQVPVGARNLRVPQKFGQWP